MYGVFFAEMGLFMAISWNGGMKQILKPFQMISVTR